MTSQPQALLTMGVSTSIVQALLPGLGERRLFHSFGAEIPDLNGFDVSYWMGGLWAQRLRLLGHASGLCSPGTTWLPSIGEDLAGRQVLNGHLTDLPDTDTRLWIKPAEAKLSAFPAAAYTPAELRSIYEIEKIQTDLEIQWTDSILPLDYEHRFFVLDGEIVTGSAYVVRDGSGFWAHYEEAHAFATFALKELGANKPPHFTVDVAFNTQTRKWLIIEGNRSWSSGVYNGDPTLAIASIDAASHWDDTAWQWQPDAQIINNSKELPLLQELAVDDETAVGFIEYKGER